MNGITSIPDRYNLYPQLEGEGGVVDPRWLSKRDWKKSANIAATIQAILEESILNYLEYLRQVHPYKNLCLSGGTMLNCVANGKILKSNLWDNVFLAPACADDGLALGAALYLNYLTPQGNLKSPKRLFTNREIFDSGRHYNDADITMALPTEAKVVHKKFKNEKDQIAKVVDLLLEGKIVAWFYRGSESGPRALGHRSILADARIPEMKDKLNLKVKHREEFRPFSPVVLEEFAFEWFDIDCPSPFMLFSVACKKPDIIPSACHIDGSARVQTVDEENNGKYYRLLKEFHRRTGIPCLINTSFNIQGEPIVETPQNAVDCFLGTELDALVLENHLLLKT